MGIVTKPHTFLSGATMLASEFNANFDAIIAELNGAIEAANLASGAVGQNELADGTVTNAKVSTAAAIALSKLAALDATIVPVTDANGVLSSSAVTPTELGHLSGVTSAIQTQLAAKLASATYTASDVLTKLKTVDGDGSGLDADTVDGLEASELNRIQVTIQGHTASITSGSIENMGIFMALLEDGQSLTLHRIRARFADPSTDIEIGSSITGESITTTFPHQGGGRAFELEPNVVLETNSTGSLVEVEAFIRAYADGTADLFPADTVWLEFSIS